MPNLFNDLYIPVPENETLNDSYIQVSENEFIRTMNNMPIKAEGTTTPRTLAERFADTINVKDFGAKGDGVTDDTAAFQAAVTAANGKSIFVPQGDYVVTEQVEGSFFSDGAISSENISVSNSSSGGGGGNSGGSVSVGDATTSTKGIVSIGDNISVSNGEISVPAATVSSKGVVSIGSNISVSSGEISIAEATSSVKGVVSIGSNISVSNGEISVPDATTSSKGVISIGSNISVSNGEISVADASTSGKGVVQLEDSLSSSASKAPTSGAVNTAIGNCLPKAGGTMTGPIGITVGNVSTTTIDLSSSDVFKKALSSDVTFAFSNMPSAGVAKRVTLVLTGGDEYNVSWPEAITWVGDIPPTLTAGPDIIEFVIIGE